VNAKHTPGPWRVTEETGAHGEFLYRTIRDNESPYRGYVASVGDAEHIKGITREEAAANANLIAAAPEMYEALDFLAGEVAGSLGMAEAEIRSVIGNTNFGCIELRLKQAEAALAKARGEVIS
jgi:hypothetical protein